jgi:SAM-dependent methyltransferase
MIQQPAYRQNGIVEFDENASEYDSWFEGNQVVYQAEIDAIRRMLPGEGIGLEIGSGTGRFLIPLSISVGIDPAWGMTKLASSRGASVCQGLGQRLPFRNETFDFALLVTVICFVPDALNLLLEAKRILKISGSVVIAFIDSDSVLGKKKRLDGNSKFLRNAVFKNPAQIKELLHGAGFSHMIFSQVMSGSDLNKAQNPRIRSGSGLGSFVIAKATKNIRN